MLKRVQKVTYEIVNEEGEEVSTDEIKGFKTKNGYRYVFSGSKDYLVEFDRDGRIMTVFEESEFPPMHGTTQDFTEAFENWVVNKIVEFYDDCQFEFIDS